MAIEMGARIKARRVELGMTQDDLATAIGCSQPNIRKIENGSIPNVLLAFDLSKKLNLSLDNLVFGDSFGGTREYPPSACSENFAPPTQVKPGYVRFPLVDTPHGMGSHLAPMDNPEILQYVEVNEDWARRALNANFAHIKIVPSIGDSMSGTIEDGSVVFVDTNTKHFAGDGLYSIVWQGRLQIKRLQARHEEKRLRIISDNKLYDPDWATNDLIISGRVLAAWNFRRF